MKRQSIALLAVAATWACTGYEPGPRDQVSPPWPALDEKDPSAILYHPGEVPRFDIELSEQAREALRAEPREYVRGTFRYGDESVSEVGVRLKGSFTFRRLDEKASFKIKFDKFVDDQRFRGLERMTLNNAIEDQSYLAERLTYRIFRQAGLPAPRANNAQVFVNGELCGLYVNVETEDETFLRRWWGDASGNLYEAAETDFELGAVDVFDLETNERANDRLGLRELIEAADAINAVGWETALSARLNTDQFLEFCALEALVSQWDGYCYSRFGFKNFRFYQEPTVDRFSFIVSGADTAMKPLLPVAIDPAPDNGQLPLSSSEGLLLDRCLADADCLARYRNTVLRMADSFDETELRRWAHAMYGQIHQYVAADPRREHSQETFELFIDELLIYIDTRASVVREDPLLLPALQ